MSSASAQGTKRKNCGTCEGCLSPNCGMCSHCKDMPQFGGSYSIRQRCKLRKCIMASSRVEATLKDRKELASLARAHGAKKASLWAAALRAGNEYTTAVRTPSVRLDEGLSEGWGAHTSMLLEDTPVEVRMDEEGLEGVFYLANIVSAPPEDATQVRVRYRDLWETEEGTERLVEQADLTNIRLQPPPSPEGYIDLVRPGDSLELFYDEGWWEVLVLEVSRKPIKPESITQAGADRRDELQLRVISKIYDKEHDVGTADVRPAWLWSPKTSSWRYELHAGHGWVPLAGKPTFKFAHGVLRASNENMGC
mmetsp:Transcript_30533/g.70003  ORF Transcript_30533/g.70003 Transcript_30533/m.70003 type:complete len:308 (+) Transcript_30533:30-953(+)